MAGEFTDWRPLHEAHSILVASITVSFGQRLTEIPWRKALIEGKALAKERKLDAENYLPALPSALMQGEAPALMYSVPQGLEAIEFMRLSRPDFAEEKFIYGQSFLRYESWTYTRWDTFVSRALEMIHPLVQNYYLPAVPIVGIGLDYVDRFNSSSGLTAPDATQVLQLDSSFLAARAFKRDWPWHTHSGWFEASDDHTKRLFNVDVDVQDVSPGAWPQGSFRTLQLRTAAIDHFNRPGLREMPNADVTVAFIRKRLQMMHDDLKEVLEEVLTHPAKKAIGLEGSL